MATSAVNTSDIECGFCLQKNEDLVDPRRLPCSHVHCLGCLSRFFERQELVQCPVQDCR